jgi:hypothetical protein
MLSALPISGLFKFGTIDILGQIILCGEGKGTLGICRMLKRIPG